MCVVCTPDKYVNDFLKSKCKIFTNGKVLLALNVGQDQTSFIADGVRQGNHWTLLALAVDVKEKLSYYGDSLRWDVPSTLTHMVEPLRSKLGIQFKSYKFMRIQSKESIDLHNFYPTQTCSNIICGVIVLCMAAIMCCDWQSWNDSTAPKCVSKPSLIVSL